MAEKIPQIAVIGLSGYSAFMSVKNFPRLGETVEANRFFVEYGGKGFNQAVAIKRLGGKVKFLTAVGNDRDGKACVGFLKKEGVETVAVKKSLPTAYANILTDERGENAVTVFRGAGNQLTAKDVENFSENILSSDLLLLQGECTEETTDRAMEIAKSAHVKIILNSAPAESITKYEIENSDYLLSNEFEEKIVSSRGKAKNLIVTLGKNGAEAKLQQKTVKVKGVKVETVDTTGAGDVFCGAFAYFLGKGDFPERAMEKAVVASGIKVGKKGALGAPTMKEFMAVYQKQKDTLWKN